MSDETIIAEGVETQPKTPTEPAQPEPTPTPGTPPAAEPKTTDTAVQEHMIPKSRLDEINAKLKEADKRLAEFEKQAAAARKAAEDADKKAKAEQGKFQELYEAEIAKREEAEGKIREAEAAASAARLDALRLKVGTELGVPAILSSRLQGETEEELRAAAALVLEGIPQTKPLVTATDAANGVNSNAPTPMKSDADILEEAARSGVSFDALKLYYEQQKAS